MAIDVSVRELRNHTADVLRRVEAGEHLRVTVDGARRDDAQSESAAARPGCLDRSHRPAPTTQRSTRRTATSTP